MWEPATQNLKSLPSWIPLNIHRSSFCGCKNGSEVSSTIILFKEIRFHFCNEQQLYTMCNCWDLFSCQTLHTKHPFFCFKSMLFSLLCLNDILGKLIVGCLQEQIYCLINRISWNSVTIPHKSFPEPITFVQPPALSDQGIHFRM